GGTPAALGLRRHAAAPWRTLAVNLPFILRWDPVNHERIYATIVDHLAKRYSECFSREEVEEVVHTSREQLGRDARHPEFLPALVGHDAHDRLLARARADCREARPVPDILFVCEHNEA